MSAEREELHRLVDALPEQQVSAVLADVRRRAGHDAAADWPPTFFASFSGGRDDLGSNHEDLLADGFGRA